MKNKKGVSPMVATVLLIAMVVVIAIILFLWFRNMVKEEVVKFKEENIEMTCKKIEFRIDYSSSTGKFTATNDGSIPIYGLKINCYSSGSKKETSVSPEEDPTGMGKGMNSGVTYTKDIGSGCEKVVVYPVLIGNSKDGTRTHICRDNGLEHKA